MNKIIAWVDGGSRGNPGPSAIGIVIDGIGKEIKEYCEFLGEATNNEAEYQSIIFALKKIRQLSGKEKLKNSEVEINMDSELVVKQLRGEYKVEDENMQKFFMKVWNLKFDFPNITFVNISREKNKKADELVNSCLNKESSKLF